MDMSWEMPVIKTFSLTSHKHFQLLILCSETLKMKRPGQSPLLQDRLGETCMYGIFPNSIFGNRWLEVLHTLFPLFLIFPVFTKKNKNIKQQI